MSSTTLSQMIMGAADGDLNYLNSTPIGSSLLDDMGLDEDDFQLSTFDVYIPEKYDSKLMSDYEYISNNSHRFLEASANSQDTDNSGNNTSTVTSRDYAIQGELLKFFIIVRPPNDSKKRQRQQKIQELLNQKRNQQSINQTNTSTPPPTKLNVAPSLVVSDTNSNSDNSINNDISNSNDNNNQQVEEKVTVLQPSTSSSQNLVFELQLRLASDYEKSIKDNQNPLNIIDYNPKHTFVNTEMRNDHISSSKSVTSYLRQNTLNVPNQNQNQNQNNNNSNNNNSNNKFIGDIIEINSPLTFKDPSSSYQKPNFFRLSNGDIVFPIEIPIYIREINEDKLITMVIKINRPKNNRMNNIYNSMDNKLERLTQGGMSRKSTTVGATTTTASISTSTITKTVLKNFQLIQPMKIFLQSQSSVPIGNRNLIAVTLENTHPTLPITINSLDIYLFHVLNMESITLIDTVQGQTSVPIHRQIGNLVKVNEHYIIKNLTGYQLPIQLEPSNQYSMVLSVEPTSVQKVLQPMDGFHTKIKLSWEIPSSCGQILSLYELKVNPPFTTDLMVSTDNKSPVTINEKFFVKFNISNLSNSSKNLTIIIPSPIIKQNQSVLNNSNSSSSNNNSSNSNNVNQTPNKSNDNSSNNSSTKKGSILKSSSSNKIINNASSSATTTKYVPVESHIQFSEIGNRSLLSFDEVQRNSVNLLCLEKSVHIGPVEAKNSISVGIEFIPLSVGIFEIPNIMLYDSIENQYFSLKEPLQICCISKEQEEALVL